MKCNLIRDALIPLITTLICILCFCVYGWFEVTGRTYTVYKYAKHWSSMGAAAASGNIEKIANAKHLWDGEYPELNSSTVKDRFSLKESEPNVKLWLPKYLNNILLARVLNDIEKRYSNESFRSFIMDITGYIPTGNDRTIGGDSVWGWYTGDITKDATNYSHRFFPFRKDIDKILDTGYYKENTAYTGSQIVIDDRIWGYFIVSFDLKELKIIRDEIIRRIVLSCLCVGIFISLSIKRIAVLYDYFGIH